MTRPPRRRPLGRSVRHAVAGLALVAAANLVTGPPPTPATPPTATTTAPVPAEVSAVPTTSPPSPQPPVGRPLRLRVPALDVDVALGPVGLAPDGSMRTPDFGLAGWYAPGPRPGDPGPAVVVAHVHGPDGPDVFRDRAALRPGDVVVVEHTRGTARFRVDASEQVAKTALPAERIWPRTTRPLLRLVTCAGTPDDRGYPDNTVVYASRR